MIKNKFFKKNLIYILFIAFGLLFSSYFVKKRLQIEEDYKNFEFAFDFYDLSSIANLSDMDKEEYFKKFPSTGIKTIALNETTIDALKSDPEINITSSLEGKDLRIKGDKKAIDFIVKGFESLKDKRNINYISENEILIEGRPSDFVESKEKLYDSFGLPVGKGGNDFSMLEFIGLGFYPDYLEEIYKVDGIKVLLRPSVNEYYQDERFVLNRFFETLDQIPKDKKQTYLVFAGRESFKDTEKDSEIVNDFIKGLNKRNIAIALIEASNQRGHLESDGISSYIRRSDVKKLRMFSTWDYIQSEYDYKVRGHHNGEEITNVYYRAISERNIASVMVKPFVKNDKKIVDLEAYSNVINNAINRLEKRGFVLDSARGMDEWAPRNFMKTPAALGVVGGGLILLNFLFNLNIFAQAAFFGFGTLLAILFFILNKITSFGESLFNLGGIIIFPLLSLAYCLKKYNDFKNDKRIRSDFNIFLRGIKVLFVSVLITMIGALYEVSFLSGTNHLLELVIFRGVKISQLLPILLSVLFFLYFIGYKRDNNDNKLSVHEINNFLASNIKMWQAILFGVLVGLLGIFLLRGGNSSTKIPGIEVLFRNALEKYTPARPRTKAVLLGYPAVISMIWLAYKKKGKFMEFFLVVLITIGQADIVNTFSHIRTPISVSFMRIGIEFIFSIFVALIFVLIYEIARRGYERLDK